MVSNVHSLTDCVCMSVEVWVLDVCWTVGMVGWSDGSLAVAKDNSDVEGRCMIVGTVMWCDWTLVICDVEVAVWSCVVGVATSGKSSSYEVVSGVDNDNFYHGVRYNLYWYGPILGGLSGGLGVVAVVYSRVVVSGIDSTGLAWTLVSHRGAPGSKLSHGSASLCGSAAVLCCSDYAGLSVCLVCDSGSSSDASVGPDFERVELWWAASELLWEGLSAAGALDRLVSDADDDTA